MQGRRLVIATVVTACSSGGAVAHGVEPGVADPSIEPARPTDADSIDDDRAIMSTRTSEAGPDVPYDRAITKSIHNAYERFEPLIDQLVYHRVRSLELDIHVRREGADSPAGEWFVYHEDNPLMRSTSCAQLSDCLGQVAAFHDALPRHEVLTLFVDLKEGFARGHQPKDLDVALVKALGRDTIATPADVIAKCDGATTIREAVTGACGFPTLRALRGKVIVVATGGTSCDKESPVATYGGDDPRARVAFIAPNVDGVCTVESYDARPNVVFFNMSFANRARAREVKHRGLVARVYGRSGSGLDSAREFVSARVAGAVHLATDRVSFEKDTWSKTHVSHGFPFTCEGGCDGVVEPGRVMGVRAKSGDQSGSSDSAFFAYETDTADATWSALVSVPSSHVEPMAKACLVARASDDPGAPNVAVCRAFDDYPPRAQVRPWRGAATTSTEATSFDGIAVESPAFLRLAVKAVGQGSEVTASASRDGKIWSTITKTRLAVPLPIRGVSVSSRGDMPVKGLFANLVRDKGGVRSFVSAQNLQHKAIGAGASGNAFDGVFPP